MTTEEQLVKIIGIPVEIRQTEISGYTLNYAKAGNGPALLLIHGANFGWGVWFPNIAELAKNFTVYAIDLPGAGRSTRVDYSKLDPKKDFLEIVEKFVEYLKLEKFSIIGFSMGGWLGLQLTLRHPEKVDNLVVGNSVGFADYMAFSDRLIAFYPFAKFIARTAINPEQKHKVEKFLRDIFYDKNLSLPEEFIQYFWETMRTSHNLLFISRLTKLHKELSLEKQLARVRTKTLVVWGENDKIIPLHKNSHNFKLIPRVQVRLIQHAGHIPSLEKPKEFNAIVENFLLANP